MTLADACDAFRTAADAYAPAAVALLRDEQAQLVAGLWLGIGPEWVDPGPGEGWEWAWSGIDLEAEAGALADVSDLPNPVCFAKLRLLVGARLIYPDGTLSPKASEILRAELVKHTAGALATAGRAKRAGG